MESAMPQIAVHVLHLNLNTRDAAASDAFYQAVFGLTLKMRSGADDGDWRFHGLPDPVTSEGWFLYDDRGARVSPSLEIVQWDKPATLGEAYPDLAHLGTSAVRLAVPSLDEVAAKTAAHGGTVVGPFEGGLLVRDPDGVYVEVRPHAGPEAPTTTRISGSRIGVSDLDASLAWYAALGFDPKGEPVEDKIAVGDRTLSYRSVRVGLADGVADFELTQWLDPVVSEPAERRLWHRGMVRMALSVEDLDTALADAAAAGLTVPEPQEFALPGTSIGSLRVVFLSDPDDFTVELVHRPSSFFTKPAK